MREELSPRAAWVLIGVLFAIVAITLPELASDPWHFRPGPIEASGPPDCRSASTASIISGVSRAIEVAIVSSARSLSSPCAVAASSAVFINCNIAAGLSGRA